MSFQLNKAYNRDSFVEFLSDKFLPEDFRPKRNVEEIELSGSQNFATHAYRLGECRSLGLEVYEIHHSSLNDARVGIAKDAFRLLLHHSFCNRALIAFVPDGSKQWRFSLIQIEAELNEHNRITRGYSNPRRYSFLLGEDTAIKTPTQFLIEKGRVGERTENGKSLSPWDDLEYRFSVEALTKEFYQKLYNWYIWARDSRTGITFPNNPITDSDDRDEIEVKIIRLITRMLFVWFIKQKKLVPDKLFDTDYLTSILKDFDPQSSSQGNYYNAILQNLFFATLNQELDKREFIENPHYFGRGKRSSESWGVKNLYRDNTKESWFTFPEDKKETEVISLFSSIPYLNGGLFECLDKFDLDENGKKLKPLTYYDGFSSNDARSENRKNLKYRAFIPNELFFLQQPKTVTVTIKQTEDGKPEETAQISVIGLIELFRQYNFTVEENTTTDTEVSLDPELLGRVFENLLAAYNPETQESARKSTGSYYTPREIVDYMVDESLKAYLIGECKNDKAEIDSLFSNGNVSSPAVAKKINHDLRSVKVLDPACGSGAFPMGILLRMTDLIKHLEGDHFNRYETKLQIIKDCIYGIDIQPIAMLICKLRFFISLICDSDYDPDNADNFGIIPLPSLETKFVAANSLLPAKVKEFDNTLTQDPVLQDMKEELLALRKSILQQHTTSEKMETRRKDRALCKRMQQYIIDNAGKPNEDIIRQCEQSIRDCEAQLPKYAGERLQRVTEQDLFGGEKVTYIDRNKEERKRLQATIRSVKARIEAERNKFLSDKFLQAVKDVTDWDPYDQNHSNGFFDAEWMFGIGINGATKQGFDIVIGNPPYVTQNKDDYPMYEWNTDLYKMFFEAGIKSYMTDDAILCYITPKFYMLNLADEDMRAYFIDNMHIEFLSYCNPFDVVTENVITLMRKDKCEQAFIPIYRENEDSKVFEEELPLDLRYSITNLHKEWVTGISTEILAILTKMNCKTKLKDISTSKRGAEISKNVLRATADGLPSLIGQDMKKYTILWNGTYLDKSHKEYRRLNPFFSKDMIYLRRVDVCLEATIGDMAYGFSKNVYGILIDETKGYNKKFILALLNSKALDFYYKKKFSTKKEDVFPEIQTYLYEQLPLPNANNQQTIIDIVDIILTKKKTNPQADTSVEENAIDKLVYQLYDLTEDEISLIEQV